MKYIHDVVADKDGKLYAVMTDLQPARESFCYDIPGGERFVSGQAEHYESMVFRCDKRGHPRFDKGVERWLTLMEKEAKQIHNDLCTKYGTLIPECHEEIFRNEG